MFHAEVAAREMGRLTLAEALDLVVPYAEVEPAKFERAAVRWLSRYLDEGKDVSLLNAHLALAALSELRSGEVMRPRSSSSSSRCVRAGGRATSPAE